VTASVDGIEYELRERLQGITTIAYDVIVSGQPVKIAKFPIELSRGGKKKPEVIDPNELTAVTVVEHKGGSGDTKWTILAGGKRIGADTRRELMDELAKVIHG